jgi:hypothetical protein
MQLLFPMTHRLKNCRENRQKNTTATIVERFLEHIEHKSFPLTFQKFFRPLLSKRNGAGHIGAGGILSM